MVTNSDVISAIITHGETGIILKTNMGDVSIQQEKGSGEIQVMEIFYDGKSGTIRRLKNRISMISLRFNGKEDFKIFKTFVMDNGNHVGRVSHGNGEVYIFEHYSVKGYR